MRPSLADLQITPQPKIGDKSLGHAVKLNMYLAFHRDSSSSLFRNEQSADFLLQQEKGA